MHWVRCAAKIQPFNFFVSDQNRFLLMVCVAENPVCKSSLSAVLSSVQHVDLGCSK